MGRKKNKKQQQQSADEGSPEPAGQEETNAAAAEAEPQSEAAPQESTDSVPAPASDEAVKPDGSAAPGPQAAENQTVEQPSESGEPTAPPAEAPVEEAATKAEDDAAAKKAEEDAAAAKQADEEAAAKKAEEDAAAQKEADDAARLEAEQKAEAEKKAAEEKAEAEKKAAEEKAEAEKKAAEDEEARIAAEEKAKRDAEELAQKEAEEEARRQEEEERERAEAEALAAQQAKEKQDTEDRAALETEEDSARATIDKEADDEFAQIEADAVKDKEAAEKATIEREKREAEERAALEAEEESARQVWESEWETEYPPDPPTQLELDLERELNSVTAKLEQRKAELVESQARFDALPLPDQLDAAKSEVDAKLSDVRDKTEVAKANLEALKPIRDRIYMLAARTHRLENFNVRCHNWIEFSLKPDIAKESNDATRAEEEALMKHIMVLQKARHTQQRSLLELKDQIHRNAEALQVGHVRQPRREMKGFQMVDTARKSGFSRGSTVRTAKAESADALTLRELNNTATDELVVLRTKSNHLLKEKADLSRTIKITKDSLARDVKRMENELHSYKSLMERDRRQVADLDNTNGTATSTIEFLMGSLKVMTGKSFAASPSRTPSVSQSARPRRIQ